jgi:hypothetical protein
MLKIFIAMINSRKQLIPFSNTFLLYLEKWSNTFLPLKVFRWTLLKNLLVWEEIQHSIKYIADADQNIMMILDKDELFNKFSHITNKMSEWNTDLIITIERWSEVFGFLQSQCISLRNIRNILEFS